MRVQFGKFTLDTESRQLRHGDAERHLSPKAFELLRALIECRPAALSKVQIHERLWPSTFVSDATLTSLVAELRSVLGEKPRGGRFVRTVHRFGYAFKGTATELTSRPSAAAIARGAGLSGSRGRCPWTMEITCLGAIGTSLSGSSPRPCPGTTRGFASLVRPATIEDLGSKNGTYLRGERLADAITVDRRRRTPAGIRARQVPPPRDQ